MFVGFELANELVIGKHSMISADIPLFSVICSTITFVAALNFVLEDEFGA